MTTPNSSPAQTGATSATQELIRIVERAGELGFPRWRVAGALNLPASDLEQIEERALAATRE